MKKLLLFLLLFTLLFIPLQSNFALNTDDKPFTIVKIYVLDRKVNNLNDWEKAEAISSGSGVIINFDKDEVLTNYHVVEDYLADKNNRSLSICFTYSDKEPPTCQFLAKVHIYEELLDLALLHVTDGYSYEEEKFVEYPKNWDVSDLAYAPVKKTNEVEMGEELLVYGYPGAGGSNITLTTGIVSGFETIDVYGDNYTLHIKTDANISAGNSGGAAFDDKNNLVGMPTFVDGDEGKVTYMIPAETMSLFLTNFDTQLLSVLEEREKERAEEEEQEECGENELFDEEVGECICAEGYEWNEAEEAMCVAIVEEALEEDEEQEAECPENASWDAAQEICTCPEGSEEVWEEDILMECVVEEEGLEETVAPIFPDVSAGNKNREAIEYLEQEEILSGYSDGTFKPLRTINRAELMKVLVEANATDFTAATHDYTCFSDTPQGEWFTPYVCYAKWRGWVDGYQDGTFRPEQTVSKSEAIKMVLVAYDFSVPTEASNVPFSDVELSDWFAPYLQVAHENGLLEETSGNYEPHDGMSRGGVSENIYRALRHWQGNGVDE